MIAILDYGIGNLSSVKKALQKLGAGAEITRDTKTISGANGLILPGVGAFGAAMSFLNANGVISSVTDFLKSGRPVLGICLGLQLLFEISEESPGIRGLSVMRGAVRRFDFSHGPYPTQNGHPGAGAVSRKVPHMGWNRVKVRGRCRLLDSVADGAYFYFAHSFFAVPEDPETIAGTTSYGLEFPSVVAKGNVFGVQFHPEKSGDVGLAILRNFMEICNQAAVNSNCGRMGSGGGRSDRIWSRPLQNPA